ncbi:MAG: 50S ribosomal protein L18 [Cytophagales bacterium]|nr:50S ribosomal protein L18 [Bernardetiaceae bacterium]MDW8209908.1 50S ribosomal protein L18 [Cytophagales bacterium]
MISKKILRRLKIKKRIRARVRGTASVPRLSVFRSNTAIYAQLIDDDRGVTLASASSREFNSKRSINVAISREVGKRIAERALQQGIERIVFDRNGYLYHGNVKSLAEGAREAGLKF